MKTFFKSEPRIFNGNGNIISDYGDIRLNSNDQVTFVTESGKRSDFTALPWGFYLTNSLNGRLKEQGFKVALVKSKTGRYYLNAVEREKITDFMDYIEKDGSSLVEWLDERE